LRFVGCGDALGSGGRFNTCFHVTGAHVNFLIDCGASSLPALKRLGIAREAIDLILITHFHGDHFGGLPFLLLDAQFTRRARPLVIAGPAGIETKLTNLMEALFEHSSKTRQRFDLSVVALEPEQSRTFGEVKVTPYPVVHGESGGPFLAYLGTSIAFRGTTARALECELVCPPSPVQLALARLVVVLGYDVALGLALSLALWVGGTEQVAALMLSWFMPLLLVAGLALALSLRLSIQVAASLAYGGWLAALAMDANVNLPLLRLTPATDALLGGIGLALLAVALLRLPTDMPRLLPSP